MRTLPLTISLLVCASAQLALAQGGKEAARKEASWVELTGRGVSIRTIVDATTCPKLTVDGKPLPMHARAAANPSFPVTTCEAEAPATARNASLNGRTLRLEPRAVKRIVVIGDTGCRLKIPAEQDCNDPTMWPFSLVAEKAAAKHPDLVIHVGDYYYRETPCPADRPGCLGSPHGDAWPSWRADFFDPASPLLAVAPWVFARGNHEQCGRGADGWFLFLDADSTAASCPAASALPFSVRVDGLTLDVIDTADLADNALTAKRLALFNNQLSGLPGAPKGSETWIITHKPLWGFELTRAARQLEAANPALAELRNQMDSSSEPELAPVDMIVSGHVHFFAALDFAQAGKYLRPAQLIVGDSGTALDGADEGSGEQVVDGIQTNYMVNDRFGYLLLEREGLTWKGTLYGIDDSVEAVCAHAGRMLHCQPPGNMP